MTQIGISPPVSGRIRRRFAATFVAALLATACLSPRVAFSAEEKKSAAQEELERRQKVELLSFFLKDPKDAPLPTTPIAVGLYNQGVRYAQNQDYELARKSLQDSLAYNNKNPFAYELLGDIDYLEQKLSDAKSHYELAYSLDPHETLKKKIEKLREETHVEKQLSTYREQHFIIKYHNEEKKMEGFELRELLRETYRHISTDFGYYLKRQVVVLLYDEKEFKDITNVPHWVAGLYDGKVRMPLKGEGFNATELRALTRHEVTHAFVAGMSNGLAPAWINEGLAKYEESKVREGDPIVLQSAVRTHQLIPLDQLMQQSSSLAMKDPLLVNLFYEESRSLVTYMIERYGIFRIKQVLAEFGKGKNSDETLRDVLRISAKRLEKEWKDTLSNSLA